ncbi:MAG: hypothetical protein MUF71_16375 [Candidatus Kapabacteria bacterium]|jgi:hypothetical protein|nr:hypothetical protein [Candidatus Kapabacteria bacterium]
MHGVILFADDNIFDSNTTENELFQYFNSVGKFAVLPIDNLTTLEKTIPSISTYKALILDWNFKRDIDGEDSVETPDETPYELLKSSTIYSLVYVYSQEEIDPEIQKELENSYPDKIFFQKKSSTNNIQQEYEKIERDIEQLEQQNKHLAVPFVWSQAINQSTQSIFSELEQADPNWIREIYQTSEKDGAEPKAEVIGVFQNLLNESIIQNKSLLETLSNCVTAPEIAVSEKEKSLAKLYQRIYYTKLIDSAPIMTGDIFKFEGGKYGILFTPECDIAKKKDGLLEFLTFDKTESDNYFTSKRKKDDSIFNNKEIKNHILPSFPFDENVYQSPVCISFSNALILKTQVEGNPLMYKLNAPYIHQLRQRYLSYMGRIGVPAIPQSLRGYNLK